MLVETFQAKCLGRLQYLPIYRAGKQSAGKIFGPF